MDRPDVTPMRLDTVKSWTPAVVATLLGLPVVAMLTQKLIAIVVLLSSPDLLSPSVPGVTNIPVSNWVIALGIAETVFLFLAAVGLIGFSWLYAERERAKASWVCVIAVGLVACIVANDLL